MPIYKRCSRCGKRMPSGATCECVKYRHKEYDRYSRNEKTTAFYHSSEWANARATVLGLDDYIDVYLYMTTGRIVRADTVHHIEPLRDNWSRRLDVDNLMSLSHDTHSMIEKRYKLNKTEIIRELQQMLIQFRAKQAGGGI